MSVPVQTTCLPPRERRLERDLLQKLAKGEAETQFDLSHDLDEVLAEADRILSSRSANRLPTEPDKSV